MKKRYLTLLFLVVILLPIVFLVSCDNDNSYSITYKSTTGGHITGLTTQTVHYGEDGSSVTAVADEGYIFVKWSDDNTSATRKESNVKSNIELTAMFSPISQIHVQYLSDDGGQIIGEAEQVISYGADAQQVEAVPNLGYKFIKWSDGVLTAKRTDKNIVSDFSVTASFEKIQYTIKFITDGNGIVDGLNNQVCFYEQETEPVTAIPNHGFRFLSWSDGCFELTHPPIVCTDNFEVKASFTPLDYTVKYLANSQEGTISGERLQYVFHGRHASTVIAIPNYGYKFLQWSDGLLTPERTDKNIQSNLTITAQFDRIYININYAATIGGYLIDYKGVRIEGAFNETIGYGSTNYPITAVPEEGYRFVKWSDGILTPQRQDCNVESDIDVTAIFEKISYNVSYISNQYGQIIGYDSSTAYYGDEISVTAVPDAGCIFLNWSDGVETATRRDFIYNNFEIEAIFEKIYDGKGTNSEPFFIRDYSDLIKMNYFPAASYSLQNNIDMADIDHHPCFDNDTRFNGLFNGNNFTIQNMRVRLSDKYNFSSLFGFIDKDSCIKNLSIINADICIPNFVTTYEPSCVGAICGVSLGYLDNISVEISITSTALDYDNVAIGGIVGQSKGTITNCTARININLTNVKAGFNSMAFNVGGIAGIAENAILNCSTYGTIITSCTSIQDARERSIGGIVGRYADNIQVEHITIGNCSTEVTITSNAYAYIGGLIGCIRNIPKHFIIENCTSIVDVNSTGMIGGLLGNVSFTSAYISNCHTSGNLCGGYVGGFVSSIEAKDSGATIINSSFNGKIETNGGNAAGFAQSIRNTTITQCYAISNVKSNARAAGFVLLVNQDSFIEKSFCAGQVTAQSHIGGFVLILTNGCSIKNCFSSSDIIVNCDDITAMGGFVCNNYAIVENCYYSGQIDFESNTQSDMLGAFIGSEANSSEIKNCHYLKQSTFNGIGRSPNSNQDIYSYEKISDMYHLSKLLNTTDETIWEDRIEDTPIIISLIAFTFLLL